MSDDQRHTSTTTESAPSMTSGTSESVQLDYSPKRSIGIADVLRIYQHSEQQARHDADQTAAYIHQQAQIIGAVPSSSLVG